MYLSPKINDILVFLTASLKSGWSYSSMNSCRSALSLFLPKIDDQCVGSHSLVLRLLKGVGKLRPPKPKYDDTWDVNVLLTYINALGPNELLNFKMLTLKLVSLLAIVTGQRVQTLAAISVNQIDFTDVVHIRIEKNIKTSGPGRPQPLLVLPPYNVNTNLYVVEVLKHYLSRTLPIRKCTSLLLTTEKPHGPASTQTISRWLKESLRLAGIDEKYTAHTFRHASTSKAAARGVLIDSIFARAGWTKGSSTFAKFYNKVIDNRCEFGLSVLN